MKELDLKRNVHDLTEEYPELIGILKEMGFLGVANAVMRNTVARVTTIPQGARKMGMEPAEVVKKLEEMGFTVKY
jgi:hypothetical protein